MRVDVYDESGRPCLDQGAVEEGAEAIAAHHCDAGVAAEREEIVPFGPNYEDYDERLEEYKYLPVCLA